MARTPTQNQSVDAYGNAARDLAPAFESARDACFFVYFDLQVGFLNAAARRDVQAAGGDPARFIGARLWDMLGYTPDVPARQAVEWVVRNRTPVSFAMRGSAADRVWVENDVVPLPAGILIWYRETGPTQAAPTPAESSGAPDMHRMDAVQRLAGGIAHDFNNLVTAIKGAAAELQEQDVPAEKIVECAKEIEQAADRAASLTAQLLAFSRRQMLRPQLFDIGAHLRAIEPSLRVALDGIGKLRTDVEPQLGSVHADPIQIERALLNLVVNARDAIRGRANGCVTIKARNLDLETEFADWKVKPAPGPYIRVDISDNGPGIDATIREHLFEPFFTTKAMGASAGFGLATAFGIVKQSNGYIWTQPAERGGTVFSVYLPRAVPASVGTTGATRVTTQADTGGNERILLVEDEDAIRRVAKRYLELAGYRITEASDGAAALQLAEQNEFDLVLTDIMMPQMLGTTLVQRLKDRFPRMPVLFMSGHSDELFKEGVIDSSTPFLAKPFTPPELAEKVRETLARSKKLAR